jgi:hypothetical protein
MTDVELKARLRALALQCKALHDEAQALCRGREAKVVSGFNGQEFGRSKPSLRGKTLVVESACLYGDGTFSFCTWDSRVNAGFGPEDVEFL